MCGFGVCCDAQRRPPLVLKLDSLIENTNAIDLGSSNEYKLLVLVRRKFSERLVQKQRADRVSGYVRLVMFRNLASDLIEGSDELIRHLNVAVNTGGTAPLIGPDCLRKALQQLFPLVEQFGALSV
jgi:hypothetical protein